MELVAPEYGLVVWTLLSLASILFSIIALVSILRNNGLDQKETLGWTIVVFSFR
jgi:hypothetical protein